MATSEGKLDTSARIQIIVAVIGLLGVVATAVISNWSSIFPKPAPTQQTTSNTSPTPVQKKTEYSYK